MYRYRLTAAIALSLAVGYVALGAGQELAWPLVFFEPLVGTEWVGRFASLPAPPFEHCVEWTAALDGQAVRWRKRVDQLDFTMETLFYWNRELEKVRFIQLASNGIHSKGAAAAEEGLVVLVGVAMHPSGIAEFKQTFEITPGGVLEDRYYSRAGEGWSAEHVIVYERIEW